MADDRNTFARALFKVTPKAFITPQILAVNVMIFTAMVVTGTGIKGMRLTTRLPYFVSGIHYPDLFVAGPEMLTKGVGGVRAAGFFGNDWAVASGESAWR